MDTGATTTKRYLPWVVATALFMEQLDSTIVNTGIPAMAASLNVTPLSLKAVVTSYILSLAVSIPISGWMAERYGTRRTFPKSELLQAMNFVIIPALLGPLLGPTVGGLIVHWFTWREIFFVNIPVGLLALWFAKNYMPNYQSDTRRPLDVRGLVLFASGAGLLSWLLEVFGEINLPIGMVVMLVAVSLGLLAAYGWHAGRVPYPLLRLSLFTTRTFRVSVLGGFATRLGVGDMPFLLPLLYHYQLFAGGAGHAALRDCGNGLGAGAV